MPYQVAYAVASKNKNGSAHSGDTHSETKISGGKLLFAVSDGMGSGEKAKRISDVTLSLIESFYKAGLKSQSILPLVNKLLAINTDDSFSALDIAVLNLNDLRADFIKFGAPRGFLINKDGIKIIEGNTLPIGIIKELEPTIISTNLSDGDMLVLMSDGIADAFKSTNEILEFFKKLPALNPKNIADETLKEALKLNNEIALDDMTVLAFRVFKNKNYVKVA